MNNYNLVIKLEIIEYNNPTNAINDIANYLDGFDYIRNIELIAAEKLIHNKQKECWETSYENMIGSNWNIKKDK